MEQLGNCSNSSVSTSAQEISPISDIPTEMLQNILHLLPFSDLLKCREVSRKFKSAATPPTRKKCKFIAFSGDISIDQDFNNCVGAADGEFPVSKFHFTLNSNDPLIDLINDHDATAFPTFYELVSPFITELSINFRLRVMCRFIDRLILGNHDYPKLTSLNLEVVTDYVYHNRTPNSNMPPSGDDTSIFTFLRGIILKAPRVQNISLKIGRNIKERDTIPRCIQELGIRANLKLLTSLKIDTNFNRVDWESLISFKLKLKIFNLTLGQSPVDTNILKTFLETQATTLNNLIFNYKNCKAGIPVTVDFPCLSELKKLKIKDEMCHIDFNTARRRSRFPTLSYQTQLPELKELCLHESVHQVQDFCSTHLAPLESLEQISLPRFLLDNYRNGNEFLQIVRMFPNIRKLQLHETNDHDHMIRVIYANMTQLEELCIPSFMDRYDYLITGLTYARCREIKEPPSESFNRAVRLLNLPTARTMACLENLKVLRLWRDDTEDSRHRNVEITEISGHVLKKMKSLKCLDFGVRKFPPIISTALKADLEMHGIRFIIRTPRHRRTKLGLTEYEAETNSESDHELPLFQEENRFEPPVDDDEDTASDSEDELEDI